MKFIPSFKFVQASILAAAAISASIVSNVSPSLATVPSRIVSAPGQPDLVIYESTKQSFSIGCPPLRNLFQLPTQQISADEYQKALSRFIVGSLPCNQSTSVQAVTFLNGDGAINIPTMTRNPIIGEQAGRDWFYVKYPTQFFEAMGIKPNQLNERQGIDFGSGANRNAFFNTLFEAGLPNLKSTPLPPVIPPATRVSNDLITDGNFSFGLTKWAANNAKAVDRIAMLRPNSGQILQGIKTTVGAKYRVSFDLYSDSRDLSKYRVSTFPLHSNVSFKLSDLSPTRSADGFFSRYSFEITGANRQIGINEAVVIDTLNFTNTSTFSYFMITNVVVEPIGSLVVPNANFNTNPLKKPLR